jgi:hypothetical protein
MDLKESELLGDAVGAHWYYQSKASALHRILRGLTLRAGLDVGAGSGFFSKALLAASTLSEATCVDVGYARDWEEQYGGHPIHYRQSVGAIAVDIVLMMDVLEHVEDDVGLVSDYAALVPQGTFFLVTVPAFQALWSGHDEFLEHRRRYSLQQVESLVHQAGLTVERSGYFFAAVLPVAATLRLAERLTRSRHRPVQTQLRAHHPLVNWSLSQLCKLELPLFLSNRVGGLSVFCLARRPCAR